MFEWDPIKASANLEKHEVSFDEASSVFEDAYALTYRDLDHSQLEMRYLTIGASSANQILIVASTDRGDKVRIISARKATRAERRDYERQYR